MVHTLPDYTTKYKMTKIFGNIDTAELAVRLGSPVILDRSGNVIWYDDFEYASIKWDTDVLGVGAEAVIDAAYSWQGGQSFKLKTGNAANNYARMRKLFLHPSEQKLGIEFLARIPTANYEIIAALLIYDGTDVWSARLSYRPDENDLRYEDDLGGWITLSDTALPAFEKELWVWFKIVVDWNLKEYVRILAGEVEYNLHGEALLSAGDPTRKSALLDIYTRTEVNASKVTYIDNVILTQNEV